MREILNGRGIERERVAERMRERDQIREREGGID
jgi:hypothetical protein